MKMNIFTYAVTLLVSTTAAADSWDKCKSQVEATTPPDLVGATGAGLQMRIIEKCGKKPTMDAETCRALYYQVMGECKENGGSLSDLSNSSSLWVTSTKVDRNALSRMCQSSYRTGRLPNKGEFNSKICGAK